MQFLIILKPITETNDSSEKSSDTQLLDTETLRAWHFLASKSIGPHGAKKNSTASGRGALLIMSLPFLGCHFKAEY